MQEQLPREACTPQRILANPAFCAFPSSSLGTRGTVVETRNTKLSFELFFVIFVPSW